MLKLFIKSRIKSGRLDIRIIKFREKVKKNSSENGLKIIVMFGHKYNFGLFLNFCE